MTELKRTPLHAEHVRAGAKMVEFAGYEMPIQYPTGIVAEHRAVRTNAGLFDLSHMGEFFFTGDAAGSQRPAVNIGGNDENCFGVFRSDERLGNG